MIRDIFVQNSHGIILEALIKIDANKKGFVIIEDEGKVTGVMTDGDVRRAFIRNADRDTPLKGYFTEKFKFISQNDDFERVIELFRSSAITFLPIVDKDMHLINIITKENMHALLLQDIPFDMEYDFQGIDDTLPDYEIYPRPWGFYKTAILNKYFQSKTIKVHPGGALSLQLHKHREEHWIVVHGEGTVQLDGSELNVRAGSYIFVPKECKHRIKNTSNTESLIFTEVQLGESFGEDDIIRFEDAYGRK